MPLPRSVLSRCLLPLCCASLFAACAAPYRPPVVVRDSAPFPGIAAVVAGAGASPVDVLLVHGMCTHDEAWARRRIASLAGTVAAHAPAPALAASVAPGAIQVVEETRPLAGGTVRFHALVWSPLTAALKHQLDYDLTSPPTDCANDRECKPVRARLNASVKDTLLDDCLSDPEIYEGISHDAMRDAMVEAVSRVIADHPSGAGTLVVVAESLGSKMLFDALGAMLESNQPHVQALGREAATRLGLLFMAGNQLPFLALAEQMAAAPPGIRALPQDALQRFLELRRRQGAPRVERIGRLALVAFTDPNDLLSYRLLPARYAAPDVAVADVLVSNDRTWLGLIEHPVRAHLGYLDNPDVQKMIACGNPLMKGCR
jgi:hypothetical protein